VAFKDRSTKRWTTKPLKVAPNLSCTLRLESSSMHSSFHHICKVINMAITIGAQRGHFEYIHDEHLYDLCIITYNIVYNNSIPFFWNSSKIPAYTFIETIKICNHISPHEDILSFSIIFLTSIWIYYVEEGWIVWWFFHIKDYRPWPQTRSHCGKGQGSPNHWYYEV
jgi:hypothetical protein